jgi:prepilin-type N-terminal cleavage/methylation domain-containing protein
LIATASHAPPTLSLSLSRNRDSFTLIELLVVVAIVAILAVVVIAVLNPAEFLKQGRDSTRVSDLASLNSALNLYQGDGGTSFGTASTVYVSLPDSSATCANLGLPALPSGYSYHCSATSTYQKADGTGWIPVDFSSISFGSPLGQLPIDPVNTTSSGNYYTYAAGGSWEMTAMLEAAKYMTVPGSPHVQKTGSASGLTPATRGDDGLVGYWKFDEEAGATAADASGNGNTGTWSGGASHWTAGKVGGAGIFGTNNSVSAGTTNIPSGSAPRTITAWIYPTSDSNGNDIVNIGPTTQYQRFCLSRGTTNNIYFCGQNYDVAGTLTMPNNAWSHTAVTFDGTNIRLYVNGVLDSVTDKNLLNTTVDRVNIGSYSGAAEWFPGLIDDVRIYKRALSAAEILALYNATK